MFSSQNYKSRIIKEVVKKADFNTKSLYLRLKAPAVHFEYNIGNLRSARVPEAIWLSTELIQIWKYN